MPSAMDSPIASLLKVRCPICDKHPLYNVAKHCKQAHNKIVKRCKNCLSFVENYSIHITKCHEDDLRVTDDDDNLSDNESWS